MAKAQSWGLYCTYMYLCNNSYRKRRHEANSSLFVVIHVSFILLKVGRAATCSSMAAYLRPCGVKTLKIPPPLTPHPRFQGAQTAKSLNGENI
jgi:hypothetical protein